MSDDRSPSDPVSLGGRDIDRRTLLIGIPAVGVAAAGCYAGLDAVMDDGGDANGGAPQPGATETPFGYGGTPSPTVAATATAVATAVETDEPGNTPTEPATDTPTPADTPTSTPGSGGGGGGGGGGSSGGGGSTETPGDYGIQGYGEFGYGGVFP